jgi:hypothetical protein
MHMASPVLNTRTLLAAGYCLLTIGMAHASTVDAHKACLEAKDYAGCIRVHSGREIVDPSINRIDQTVRPGLLQEQGNQCPTGFGYAGGGRCRSVVCRGQGIFGQNDPALGDKGHSCSGGAQALNQGIFFGRGTLTWGNDYVNASYNPNCPSRELQIGELSTCPVSESAGRGLRFH